MIASYPAQYMQFLTVARLHQRVTQNIATCLKGDGTQRIAASIIQSARHMGTIRPDRACIHDPAVREGKTRLWITTSKRANTSSNLVRDATLLRDKKQ